MGTAVALGCGGLLFGWNRRVGASGLLSRFAGFCGSGVGMEAGGIPGEVTPNLVQ